MDKYLPEELISRSRYLEILSWSREDAENANELWVEKDMDPNWQKRKPDLAPIS
jgi:hypothetical protein